MSKTIKCPHCGTEFQIDESNYNELLAHIRNEEFEAEINARLKAEKELNETKLNNVKEIESNKAKEEMNKLSANIAQLENKIQLLEQEKINVVNQTKSGLEKEIADLKSKVNGEKDRIALAVNNAINEKEKQIIELENKANGEKDRIDLAVSKAVSNKENEISALSLKLEEVNKEKLITENNLKEQFEKEMKAKDDLIAYYKDLKTKMSTKMLGETLEQHCSYSFNSIRTSTFPRAYFEKDNDISINGSKGDFIYRDYDENGTEFISIMFEMKNEMDTTATKHKNEDFFKKLDTDRDEKQCEYAVLVSTLEADSDLYNQGIVDVSYRYKKMYVIRPQFFIPLITLLKNASLNAAEYKNQLQAIKSQQIDVVNFEDNLNEYKEYVEKNYLMAKDKFDSAIDEIDKTIDRLLKVKKTLEGSSNNLRLAASKGDSVTIKKLTKNSPSLAAKFDAIDNEEK